eukprot:c25987_g1_i1.p1 GENE.c25987_g1_i1~~c25987_g1_i1.p1  ORF type:complete len:447 (-),score=19.82 c25987_g1_i1:94-1434(-)
MGTSASTCPRSAPLAPLMLMEEMAPQQPPPARQPSHEGATDRGLDRGPDRGVTDRASDRGDSSPFHGPPQRSAFERTAREPPPQAGRLNSLSFALFSRGVAPFAQIDVHHMQPLEVVLVLAGAAPWRNPFYVCVYRPLSLLLTLAMPALLGWGAFITGRLSQATVAGMALASLVSVVCWVSTSRFVESRHALATGVALVGIDPNRAGALRSLTKFYTWIGILCWFVVSACWVAVIWASHWAPERRSASRLAFVLAHSIAAPVNLGVLIASMIEFAVCSHLHRLHLVAFANSLLGRKFPVSVSYAHYDTVHKQLALFSRAMETWLAALLLVWPLSITFQLVGLYRFPPRSVDYHGIYYLLALSLALLLVVWIAGATNRQHRSVIQAVASMFSDVANNRDELASLLLYMRGLGSAITVHGTAITMRGAGALACALFALLGALIHRLTI